MVFSAAFHDVGFSIKTLPGIDTLQLPLGFNYDALSSQEPNIIKHFTCLRGIRAARPLASAWTSPDFVDAKHIE